MVTVRDLEQARGAALRIRMRKDTIARLWSEIERTTTRLQLVGGGGGSYRDKLADFAAQLEEIEAECRDAIVEHEKKAAEISAWIDSLPHPESSIVYWYYIDEERFCGWDVVGQRLARHPESCRRRLWELVDSLPEE